MAISFASLDRALRQIDPHLRASTLSKDVQNAIVAEVKKLVKDELEKKPTYESVLAMGTEMVKLVVGAESPKSSDNTFLVHKDLLCRKIPYFKNMFTDGWKESDEKGATFPEDDVKSFDVLLGWVYTGVLKPLHDVTDKHKDKLELRTWDPVSFYILTQKMCLPLLQDMTMDLIACTQYTTNGCLSADSILHIYQSTQPGCALQRFASRTLAFIILEGPERFPLWPTTRIQALLAANADLNLDVLDVMRGINHKLLPDPRKISKCEFHQHGKDEDCHLA